MMRGTHIKALAAVVVVGMGVGLLHPSWAAAQPGDTSTARSTLTTSWGHPDLQGVWDFSSNTPMERPAELADRAELTDEEVAERLQRVADQRQQQDTSAAREGDTGTYNRFWTDSPRVSNQASLVVDPPNGQIPAYTAVAEQWYADLAATREGVDMDAPTPGGFVEDLGPRGLFVRCLVGFNAGPPIKPQSYNQNVQIFQDADHVVLLHEMVHNVRVVPLDGRPPVPDHIRQFNGDSRGRWEGDTLVVETTNFGKEVYDPGVTGGGMRANVDGTFTLIERFTRTAPDTLVYEFTIEDPTWYTAPFTARIPMTRSPYPLYEFACHEGNYGLTNILAGAR